MPGNEPVRDGTDSAASARVRSPVLFGIFLLLLLASLRIASDICVPFMAAVILTFVLQPLHRLLLKLHIPAYASALLIILILMGGVSFLASALAAPAAAWTAEIPESLPELKAKLKFLSQPVEKTRQIMSQAEDMASPGPKATPVALQGSRLFDRVVNGTGTVMAELLTTLLLLFFFLAAGGIFLRHLIEVFPGFADRRQIVDILHCVESDVSRYLMTITIMNAVVGLCAGLIMLTYGVDSPLLWGIVAFLLNFVPIMGPVMVFMTFLVVGFIKIPVFWTAVMPAVLFLCTHVMESAVITPRLLARQFTINPLIVILSLVFWYWMWGFAGVLLAVPMVVVTKIICGRVDSLKPLGHMLEG